MAWGSVKLVPGVNVEKTPTLNEAGISVSKLIRFKDGLAQKIGGWVRYFPNATGGVPRALHAWQDLNKTDHLAAGTTTTLAVVTGGTIAVISPQTKTTNFTPNFTTTAGSALVTVDDSNIANVTTYDTVEFKTPVSVGGIILSGVYPIDLVLATTKYRIVASMVATAPSTSTGTVPFFTSLTGSSIVSVLLADHGLAVGDDVVFPLSTTFADVTISGTYSVVSVLSINEFTIAIDAAASTGASASMNGSLAQLTYYIALGPATTSTGYGIGPYGSGGYGTGSATSAQAGTPITSTDWTFDNWGSTLLACPEGGGVYAWSPDAGFQNARLVSGAPLFSGGIFVAAPAQILVAWGTTQSHAIGIDRDPLSYSWSDQLDYGFWTPGVVNPATGNASQAGTARIPTGSKIVAGLQAPQQALLWTDLDLWAINYIGAPEQGLTFGQNKVASSCGALGAHAVGQLGNTIYWMGRNNFFAFSGGGVSPLPCTVWDAVFQDLDVDNAWKVRACPNTPFNEMMWAYPSLSGGTGENDSYVKVNVLDGSWDIGPSGAMARSAWIDQSVIGNPIGASPAGLIYEHETGEDADGRSINWKFKTGYWVIAEGEQMAFVDLIIPDFRFGLYGGAQSATVLVTLYAVDYPGATERTYGPYTVTSATKYINTRFRGRQMAIGVAGQDLGSFARLGRVRFRFAPDGRL